ncbi:ATP-binding protein [Rivularia sp. UHCC 0363]|uniref:hybrid sensor histidine kinase/response regulator n=1 Tax=Rivularia sp. UHCC 0363 TaxID=3110244 RepID=UPI002B21CF2E|nr:ATP-binding protein [Rivularia sp. UHCC 0363]MEA5594940.1 ATP-binding protein [Rivularia sp. UHCC 0363]
MLNQQNKKLFREKDQSLSLIDSFAVNHKFGEAITNHPSVLVIVQDRLGQIVCFNQACESIVGSTLDQVKGKFVWDLCMIPEQVEMSQAVFQQVLSGKYPVKNDNYLVDKNGNSYLISWFNTALTDSSTRVEYVISVGFHVTPNFPTLDTGQSEWNSQKFRAVFDESSEFMALLQPNGQFIEANQALLDFANLRLLDIAGKYLWKMDWWKSGDKTQAQLKDIVLQALKGESVRCEMELLGNDKSERTIDFSLKPFRNEIGKVVMLRLEGRDITEKKQLEAQVFHLQRLESIAMLASGIVHDINNILTPVLGIAHLLKHSYRNADVKTHKLLDILETNVKNGAKLVEQVLSYSRPVRGKRTEIQVGKLISEVKDFAQSSFPESIQIHTHIPPNLWLIRGDVTQLHQVVMNLCINARDAMPKGGALSISVDNLFLDENYVRICPDAKTGAYIEITVLDVGNGIHPEILDQIFEPFFTTKLDGGTGLGLSTVKTIVKNHGGFIHVYSKPQEETIFKIYLPALQQPDIQALRETLPTGNGELILIVDDEPTICNITKTTLETYGYRALVATDGFEAIALYAQHKHEIKTVLMDITMPLINSENAIYMLRKMNPQIQTIALSGFNCVSQRVIAIENGVQAFLPKPYTTERLLQTVHQVIHGEEE